MGCPSVYEVSLGIHSHSAAHWNGHQQNPNEKYSIPLVSNSFFKFSPNAFFSDIHSLLLFFFLSLHSHNQLNQQNTISIRTINTFTYCQNVLYNRYVFLFYFLCFCFLAGFVGACCPTFLLIWFANMRDSHATCLASAEKGL